MMINCPKCNFLQPKDQYCAQCGVNMETYRPPQAPLWKKLLSNWMVQLGILFFIIFGLVIFDSLSKTISKKTTEPPPVASRIQRKASVPVEDSSATTMSFAPQKTAKPLKQKKAQTQLQPQVEESETQALPSLEKRIEIRLVAINPNALDSLNQQGKALDETVYNLGKDSPWFQQNQNNLDEFSPTSEDSFEFNQPMEIFLGEQDPETGTRIGFFVQVTLQEKNENDTYPSEIRIFHQLKREGEQQSTAIIEDSLQANDELVVLAPNLYEENFSPEELSYFENSSYLNGLNSEMLIERLSDLAIIIRLL